MMELADFAIIESPLFQGVTEQVIYNLTTTPWGSSPSSPSLTITDRTGADVTASVTSGSTTVLGDVITLAKIQSLSRASSPYKLLVEFTIGSNRLSTWAELVAR